jgi:hypothetical protein
MSAVEKRVVSTLLSTGGLIPDAHKLPDEEQQALASLYSRGLVIPMESDPRFFGYCFSSPIHEFVTAQCIYCSSLDVHDFDEFISLLVQRMSPEALRLSEGRSARSNRPLEGQFHLF